MSKIHFTQFIIDEVKYFIDFITANIAEYKLSELTNGNAGDIPSIQGAHPLAIEYGNALAADEEGNYTSILPAIGVELLDDDLFERQLLGAGYKNEEVTQDFIDEVSAIQLKDRFNNGTIMSNTVLNNIQDAKTAKGSEKLWASSDRYLERISINISIWSEHIEVTRILYMILRSILKRAKRDLSSKGIKNLMIKGQNALYNYEFGTTLFGSEFNLSFINLHKNVEIDTDLETLKIIEHHLENEKSGPKLTSIGGEGQYPET